MIMEKTGVSQEQSMEEILQSIKRIIADDESAEAEEAAKASAKNTASKIAEDEDILELSDFVDAPDAMEHNSLSDLLSAAPASTSQHKAPINPADDILASIDGLLNAEVAQASTSALQQLRKLNQTQTELQQPNVVGAVSFRSGVTLEDIVVEMLKPELKTWLNNNLPQIVERLVQAEIKKISAS
jgi:uncharacterized protein